MTDDSGAPVTNADVRYLPFGEARSSTTPMLTDKLFTGQRLMADLGIYHYGARFYSPRLGRFLSADTIVPGYANPQNLNRYSYVGNNPLRSTDPTGHYPCIDTDENGRCVRDPDWTPADNYPDNDDNGDDGDPLEEIQHLAGTVLINFFYNPYFGGSSSGCNTWILTNTSGSPCHHNMYLPVPICRPGIPCSERDEWDYATRFQYPLQPPWMPVALQPGDIEYRSVMGGDFLPGTDWYALGSVQVTINGSTLRNTTLPPHIFYNGQIERTISNGFVFTEGQGTNRNHLIAAVNQYIGPLTFQATDAAMLMFSTVDQLSNGSVVQWMNAMPPLP